MPNLLDIFGYEKPKTGSFNRFKSIENQTNTYGFPCNYIM